MFKGVDLTLKVHDNFSCFFEMFPGLQAFLLAASQVIFETFDKIVHLSTVK